MKLFKEKIELFLNFHLDRRYLKVIIHINGAPTDKIGVTMNENNKNKSYPGLIV